MLNNDVFDAAFNQAWNEAKTPLDKLYDVLTQENWEDMPQQTYFLYDIALKPIQCCVCEENGHWVKEDDNVYVCEHEPIAGASFACRQLDSMRADLVGYTRPGL